MEGNLKIQTKRLSLIPCSDEESKLGHELAHVQQHLMELKKDPLQLGWGPWFISDKANNQMVGDAGFKGKPDLERKVEIGYGIIDSARNQGYATEAVEALVKWAFASSYVDKVIAECFVTNLPSIKVLEKVGMSRIAVEKNMLKWEISRMNVK
ncbi:N-acetyltransferase [Virgibacillus pantothenticus]|uniref:GNAT family N-acetyltransferase n=1 Tax=Virgibacillus pantothenticus TaxID=1473 RepID=UPI001B1E355C|nr:GNAT family N-acetyltransferase [Virgibacillus pantothenticus]MBU8568790.1 GNAT family N-acetyltransferase [Virgibacillus pantothenticus]MBU8602862.1 GNAT family N-acetyltransferase [Virgibacillus pantothenticus]MBU8636921.1 GNAT family N-acetyltransferase [Virgibacillus pantothenticus]MBU8644676.1 GNAT family N-acetyltransferase [Virgibacillus pantothenticus]MBU8648837.1 GNAT family N-acetyltransferase [Virgibacillus pantothenticus]